VGTVRWREGLSRRERREAEDRIAATLVEVLGLTVEDLDDDPPPPGTLLSLAFRPRRLPPPD